MVTSIDGKSIAEAVVAPIATTAPTGMREIAPVSGEDGGWILTELVPGEYTFRVSAPGFKTTEVKATVKPGEGTRLNVTLQPDP